MKARDIFFALSLCFCIAIAFSSCKQQATSDETEAGIAQFDPSVPDTITIAGAYALYPLALEWAELFHEKYPNIHFEVIKASVEESKRKASQGLIDLAMISQELQIRKECFRVAVAKGGIVPIMNAQNPFIEQINLQGLTHQELVEAYQTGSYTWGQLLGNASKDQINLYYRADTSGAGITWAQFLWLEQSEIMGIPVNNEDEMLEKISKDPLGIGYANMNNVFDHETRELLPGLKIIPFDLNYNGRIDLKEQMPAHMDDFHRTICLGKYPKNLCRNLYFAAPEKPKSPAILEFIQFCLTEGQVQLEALGYGSVQIPQ